MADTQKNKYLALSLLAIVVGMLLMVAASVPLYRLFCQATGFGGRARVTSLASHPIIDRTLEVRFDANVHPGLLWTFVPLQTKVTVKAGEEKHIAYSAKNNGSKTSKGTAVFNVTPVKAGAYFDKIQCFCFSEQTLVPGEEKQLDVDFFIDPAIANDHDLDDVRTITLSYTFFPVKQK